MNAPRTVVVTGLGVVGPFGVGREAFLAGLQAGAPRLTEIERSPVHRAGGARLVARVSGDISGLLPPGAARRMSPPSRLAVAAARLALADAGASGATAGDAGASDADPSGTGIVTATAYGPTWVTEQLVGQILRQGPEATSPALFTESVANASAAQVALALRARGPNETITQREASELVALAEALRWIRGGRAERVVVGVVEEIVPILHAVLDRYGALARAADGIDERPRPFDRRRNGLLLAEGAAMLVLESAEGAARRGVRPLAVCRTAFAAFDATAPAWAHGTGEAALGAALRRGLERETIDPAGIDLVVSGASGSRRGDRLEALTLRRAFGERLPGIVAPKGTTGEYGGGHLAAAVLAASGADIGATAGFEEEDPVLGIRPRRGPFPGPPSRLLVSALAAGGAAAWAVLEAPAEPRTGTGV